MQKKIIIKKMHSIGNPLSHHEDFMVYTPACSIVTYRRHIKMTNILTEYFVGSASATYIIPTVILISIT